MIKQRDPFDTESQRGAVCQTQRLIEEDNHGVKTAFSHCSTLAANWLEIKTNEQLPHQ